MYARVDLTGKRNRSSKSVAILRAMEGKPPVAADYWRSNLRMIALLLAIWAFVSIGLGIIFVEPLNQFHLGGFPLGFWFAQQGSIYVFILLILVYALWMDRLDRKQPQD